MTSEIGQIVARLEAQIAIRENSDEPAVLGDWHAGNPVAAHHFERFGNLLFGIDRNRIDNHAAFAALYAVDLFGLPLDRHVPMDNADAALLRERDRQMRFRDRIHGGADDRNFQLDFRRKTRRGVGVRRRHVAVGWL